MGFLDVKRRTVVDINKAEFDWDSEKIVLKTHTDENIMCLARKNSRAYSIYTSLMDHDFILYMHKGQQSYFIKRNKVYKIWKRKDLTQKGDTFYTVQTPIKVNKLASKKLVVIFSSMPPGSDYFSAQIAKRTFVQNYPSMPKHLIKNTYILRIMDLNRSSGSYYLNAGNYMSFESDVQEIINDVRSKYDIANQNVVMYGTSKGGTGALYHSILGDYHAVVVDPIFSIEKYNKDNDLHFLRGVLPEKLLPKFENALAHNNSKQKKVVLGTSRVLENYSEYSKLTDESICVLDLQDEKMKDHISISPNCVPEQITYINGFLMDFF